MQTIDRIPVEAIRDARERIADLAIRTPLVRLNTAETGREIFLKLENLQPIGSFKVRGAGNALLQAGTESLADGVFTASAGNMGQEDMVRRTIEAGFAHQAVAELFSVVDSPEDVFRALAEAPEPDEAVLTSHL